MPDDPNLDSILKKESQPKLTQLDPDFYEKASTLIKDLEAEKNGTEPGTKRHDYITDLVELAKGQVKDIIQARMRKIIGKASSQSAKRDKSDAPPLTREELEFYNKLIDLMTGFRHDRLEQVFGKREVSVPRVQKGPEIPKEKTRDISGYVMVRLLTNVPTFVGMDNRNYTLAKEDVAMVPGMNAKALIARNAAVQIDSHKTVMK